MKIFIKIFRELRGANQPINAKTIEWWLDVKIAQRNRRRALNQPLKQY